MPGGTASNIVAYIAKGDMVGEAAVITVLPQLQRPRLPRHCDVVRPANCTAQAGLASMAWSLAINSRMAPLTPAPPCLLQPLSIMMTTASTLMAIATTPILTSLLVG